MTTLDELKKLKDACDLIRAGMRPSIVRGLTGVSSLTLRKWWKDIHKAKPSNGKLPETVLSYIKDYDSAAVISAYAAFHTRLRGKELTPDGLLATWREYSQICVPIDINAAYYAIRDIRAKIVVIAKCSVCNAAYIYDVSSKHTCRCPFCKTKL